MGKAIAIKPTIVQKQANYHRKNKPSNGNRGERNLRDERKKQATDSKNQQ